MTTEYKTKLNQLLHAWPTGTVALQPWLTERSISPNLTNWYLKASWIESVGHGAYKKPGDDIKWSGGLYAIQQQLNRRVHVGARSALEILGFGHYVRLGSQGKLFIFGEKGTALPLWFKKNDDWKLNIKFFTPLLFDRYDIGLLEKIVDGNPIIISCAERSISPNLI